MKTMNKMKASYQLVQDINESLGKYFSYLDLPLRPMVVLETEDEPFKRIEKVSLLEIIEILDSLLNDPEKYPRGVRTKLRSKRIKTYRHIGFKIARDMEHTCEDIAAAFDVTHSSVIHGSRRIDDQLSINDRFIKLTYGEVVMGIKDAYKKKYGEEIDIINISKSRYSSPGTGTIKKNGEIKKPDGTRARKEVMKFLNPRTN